MDVMRGMNSESVDLIYLDPPFNSNATYKAPTGSDAAGAAFKDTWGLDDLKLAWHAQIKHEIPALHDYLRAIKVIHSKGMMAYLIYMAVRIMEMKRLMKPTGSIYLHCDPYASHYLKVLMDSIFGRELFKREIIWKQPNPSGFKTRAMNWIRNHDTLFYYAIDKPAFTPQYMPYGDKYLTNFKHTDEDGKKYWLRSGKRRYLGKGIRLGSCWTDIHSMQVQSVSKAEGTGYPTQKPIALLRRIIRASSNEGDMVLDPFCGCATTCVAAEIEHREWVGIDIAAKAAELVVSRLHKEVGGLIFRGAHREDIPERTDLGEIIPYREHKTTLYEAQSGNCAGCKEHFDSRHLEVDHILPKSKGGSDHKSNLQLLCGSCNRIKGDRTQEYLLPDFDGLRLFRKLETLILQGFFAF